MQQSTRPGVYFEVANRILRTFFKNVSCIQWLDRERGEIHRPTIFHPITLSGILALRSPLDAIRAVPALCFQVPEFGVLGYQRRGASKSD